MTTDQHTIAHYVRRIERLTGITPCQQVGPIGKRGRPIGRTYAWADRYLLQSFLYEEQHPYPANLRERMEMHPAGSYLQGTPYHDTTKSTRATIKQLVRLLDALQEFDKAHPPLSHTMRIEQQSPLTHSPQHNPPTDRKTPCPSPAPSPVFRSN